MAFDKKNLQNITAGVSNLNKTFEYHSADNITGAGYFPKDDVFKAGDKVVKVVISKTGELVSGRTETPYVLIANADGVLTATAM